MAQIVHDLADEIKKMEAVLDQNRVKRCLRRAMAVVAGKLRKEAISRIGAEIPQIGTARVKDVVRRKVYRDLSALRVYVAGGQKGAIPIMHTQHRFTQWALPLPFWYENGFVKAKGGRTTKGRGQRKTIHSTGIPKSPELRGGVHVLDELQSEEGFYHDQLDQEFTTRVNSEFEKAYGYD